MKNLTIIITSCIFHSSVIFCGVLYSQQDSSAESFFPSQLGNVWRYQQGPFQSQGTVKRDSVVTGSRYIFFDSSVVPAYEIDSKLNIISDPTTRYRAVLYNLHANKNDTWIVKDTSGGLTVNIVARVDEIFWGSVLGTLTQIKKIGYYYQPVSDSSIYTQWRNDNYIAAGFGFYMSIYDASQTPEQELIGCVINGKKYGMVLSVQRQNQFLHSTYKLHPAFPNPFNSTTILSYQLPTKSTVFLKVFDMLGREIATLVNGEQQSGYHAVPFTAHNLSSGVYLIKITAEAFTQTIKINYSK